MTTPILFLSGAGLPAWIWDSVRAGLPVESRVADRPGDHATLSSYAEEALATADGWDSFAVVAHSVGGVVARALLAQAPERAASFVGIAACVPEEGSSFLGTLPFPQRRLLGLVMRVVGTRPPAREIRDGLCRGVDAEHAERIVQEFRPESQALYRDAVPAGAFPAASTYVLTTGDTQFAPRLQERFAARVGGEVVRVDTAHLPMLEQPDALADVVVRATQAS